LNPTEPFQATRPHSIDHLLRGKGAFDPAQRDIPLRSLVLLFVTFGFAYGLAMGSYAGRPLQMLFSGLKVPLLLGVATSVCLLNFFVVNSLLGLREDFGLALRAVLSAQAAVAISLAAFMPVILFFYASLPDARDSYPTAIAANGGVFLVASLGGQLALNRSYRTLVERNQRHRYARIAWLGLYVFVAIQLAWTLRPFIGDPEKPTGFLRSGAWGNAYVEIVRLLGSLLD
jgi:drug/metabolite transporter superfamily protein YnfA